MTAVDATLPVLPEKRRGMLLVLRRLGEARAEDLADALDVTVSAARQHLQALVAAGLVGHRQERGRPGRPRHVYHLETAADAYFPKAYDDLSRELLSLVRDEDPVLLTRIFERRRRRRVERATDRTAGLAFPARVREVARMLDEEGYLAAVEELPDGSFRLTEHNCAVLGAAQEHPHICSSEIDFLREVLPDATVDRVSFMMDGAHVCAYAVRPS
jgi:DeoR family transcriptional regulator, suf operon transcriptional repressor